VDDPEVLDVTNAPTPRFRLFIEGWIMSGATGKVVVEQ
jgi:hypothetical protein